MKSLLKNEILLCLRKKNIIVFVFACIFIMFIFQFYFETNYNHNSKETMIQIQEEIQKSEVNIYRMEIRLAGLKEIKADEQMIEETSVILNNWKLESEYANYLKVLWYNDQMGSNEAEIRKVLADRDQNAFNTRVENHLILNYTGLYRNSYRDLLNREKLRVSYQMADVLMPMNPRTPTGSYVLNEALSGFNPIMILILICVIIWNADMWSNEFDNNGFQILFTLPYKKSRIYFMRNIVRFLFTLTGVTLLILLLFVLGTFKYGHGFDQFSIVNQQGLSSIGAFEINPELLLKNDFSVSILTVIIYKMSIIFLYLLCFISFINLSSLFCKEKGLSIFVPSILMLITYMIVQTADSASLFMFIPSCYLLTSQALVGDIGISMIMIVLILTSVSSLLYFAGRQYITHADLKGIR